MFPAEKSGKEVFRRDGTEDIGGAPQIVDFDTIFEFRGPETVQVRPEAGGIVRDVQCFGMLSFVNAILGVRKCVILEIMTRSRKSILWVWV